MDKVWNKSEQSFPLKKKSGFGQDVFSAHEYLSYFSSQTGYYNIYINDLNNPTVGLFSWQSFLTHAHAPLRRNSDMRQLRLR